MSAAALPLVLVLGSAGTAAAQSPADSEAVELNEIVVTASKRELKLQDVAASVTVLTDESLKQLNATRFVDYGRSIPSLSITEEGPGETKLNIRGVTTGRGVETDSTVAVYLDETPITGFGNFQPDLRTFDLDRVEVLKGPQGTLFGSNAMGGAVRFITKKPNTHAFAAEFDGSLSKTKGAGDLSVEANAMVNIPIVADKFAIRAVFYHQDEAGWVDNVFRGEKDVNVGRTNGGRIIAQFTPNEDLTVSLTGIFQDSTYGGDSAVDPAVGDLNSYVPADLYMTDALQYVNGTLRYGFGPVELISSTTYHHRDFDNRNDFTGTFTGDINEPITLFTGNNTITGLIHETRISSSGEGRFNYIAGVYYERSVKEDDQYLNNESLAFSQMITPLLGGPGLSTNWFDATITNTETQLGLFGELSYKLTPELELTVGARRSKIKLEDESFVFGEIAATPREEDAVWQRQSLEQSKTTLKFLASYKPRSNLHLYASASEGYRQGGFGGDFTFLGLPPDAFSSFTSDTLWNYEVGAKTSLFDGRWVINAAAFYIDWTDIQLNIFVPRPDGTLSPFTTTTNAGAAHISGFEIETSARLTPNLHLTGGVSINNAFLDSDQPAVDAKKGDRLPLAPQFIAAFTLDYSRPIGVGDWEGFGVLNYSYTGETKRVFNAATYEDGFSLVGGRLGVRSDKMEVALYGRNLFDERAVLISNPAYGGSRINSRVVHPRVIGVNVTLRY